MTTKYALTTFSFLISFCTYGLAAPHEDLHRHVDRVAEYTNNQNYYGAMMSFWHVMHDKDAISFFKQHPNRRSLLQRKYTQAQLKSKQADRNDNCLGFTDLVISALKNKNKKTFRLLSQIQQIRKAFRSENYLKTLHSIHTLLDRKTEQQELKNFFQNYPTIMQGLVTIQTKIHHYQAIGKAEEDRLDALLFTSHPHFKHHLMLRRDDYYENKSERCFQEDFHNAFCMFAPHLEHDPSTYRLPDAPAKTTNLPPIPVYWHPTDQNEQAPPKIRQTTYDFFTSQLNILFDRTTPPHKKELILSNFQQILISDKKLITGFQAMIDADLQSIPINIDRIFTKEAGHINAPSKECLEEEIQENIRLKASLLASQASFQRVLIMINNDF